MQVWKYLNRQLIQKIAKSLAYVTLIILATYGLKQLFGNLEDMYAYVLTAVIILLIAYITEE